MRMRNWVAVASGLVAVGAAFSQQPPKSGPVKPASATAPDAPKPADALAAMLADARAAYAKTRDYSGTFTRQEMINGKLSSEQVGEMKMRVNPVGVSVKFVRPETASGMEVVYSSARKDGKVGYKEAGVKGIKYGLRKVDPDDSKFLADSRHPATSWGMGPIIELIATATAREKKLNNPVETFTADFQFANRNVTRYEIYMRRPHALRYAAKMVVYVDKETKLPVRFEAFDDPRGTATTGPLLECYSFSDLKFNTGLGENSFEY